MNALQQLATRLRPPLSRTRRGAIGIDLSLTRLHMVQFSKLRDGRISLHAQASLKYPESRDELLANAKNLKAFIHRGLAANGFSGRSVVLGMPSGTFRTISVNYRPQSQLSDDQVIAKLMAERLDGAISDYVLDYIPVRSEARDAEKLAIVAVSPRSEVTAFLDNMRNAGLEVSALEISPVAIRRLTTALPSETTDMVLILNTGVNRSYLTMLSGRRLLLDQPIEFCESRLLAALSRTLDISEESARNMVLRVGLDPGTERMPGDHREGETGIFNTLLEILKPEFMRLIEETDRAFMYAAAQARGGGDAKIYLFGSLARWEGADRLMARMTHLPVTTLPNPLSAFGNTGSDPDHQLALSEPEYAVAAGLALRGLVTDE